MKEMISLKLDSKFLKLVDSVVASENYSNRTEFIRECLREKISSVEIKKALLDVARGKGGVELQEKVIKKLDAGKDLFSL